MTKSTPRYTHTLVATAMALSAPELIRDELKAAVKLMQPAPRPSRLTVSTPAAGGSLAASAACSE